MKKLYYFLLIIVSNTISFQIGYSQLGNNEIMELEDLKDTVDYKQLYLDLKKSNDRLLELNEVYKQLAEARDLMYKDVLYVLYHLIDIETEKELLELMIAIPDILQQHNIIESIITDEIDYINNNYKDIKKI